MVKSWFSGSGAAAWQSLLDGSASWSDFSSFWHARFSAVPPLDQKSGVAAVGGLLPHAAAESAGAPQESAVATTAAAAAPLGGTESPHSNPMAAFEAMVDETGRFGTILSYDFSEKSMMTLTGTGPLDRGAWHGALSAASFDADIAKAVGQSLTAGHGLFFTPDSGDFAGEAFLVVDANGKAGFQAGEDIVYHLMPVFLDWGHIQAVTPMDQLLPAPHVG